jgi:tripartite-type tricarboxylate transporter receptor subunit TctC
VKLKNIIAWRSVVAGAVIALVFGLVGVNNAKAASVEDLYNGQTLTILIGHPPGGSYDLYAQLAAAHLGKFVPGNPNVIVQHMPGGGGSKAAAHFMANIEADGLTVALLPDTMAHVQLLRPKRGKWDSTKIRYIGRFAPTNSAFAIHKDAAAKTLEDMKTVETKASCTGKSSRSAQMPALLKNLAGMNLKLICGYKGSSAATLAVLKREVDMINKAWPSFKSADAAELESGNLKIILQSGLERDPDLPDVPLLQEIVDDPKAKEVMEFASAAAPIGRSLMTKEGIPADVLAALRDAFQKMMADEAFLADAKKRKADIIPATGEAMEKVVAKIMSASPELIAAAKAGMDTSSAGKKE